MAFKSVLFCVSTLLLAQFNHGQCIPSINPVRCGCSAGGLLGNGLLSSGLSSRGLASSGVIPSGCGGSAVIISSDCGSFIINCVSPIAPTGVSVVSALDIIGELFVSGGMPFLSAVAFEATLPSIGAGSVAYGCGDGVIGIEGISGIGGIGGVNGYGGNIGNIGYGGVYGGCGCL